MVVMVVVGFAVFLVAGTSVGVKGVVGLAVSFSGGDQSGGEGGGGARRIFNGSAEHTSEV